MSSPPGPYSLSFVEHPGYLYAHIRADTIDAETALDYLRKIAEKAKDLRSARLMLFREIPAMLPDSDLFFVTNEFLAMIRPARVAFINPFSPIAGDMDFAVMIGTNRGADYALFNNIPAAERWLTG